MGSRAKQSEPAHHARWGSGEGRLALGVRSPGHRSTTHLRTSPETCPAVIPPGSDRQCRVVKIATCEALFFLNQLLLNQRVTFFSATVHNSREAAQQHTALLRSLPGRRLDHRPWAEAGMGRGAASGPQGLNDPLACGSLNEKRQTSHTMWSSEVDRAQPCGRRCLQGSEPTETHTRS